RTLSKIREHADDDLDEFLDVRGRLVEELLLLGGQLELDDFFNPLAAEQRGNADEVSLGAELAVAVGGAGDDALLVLHNGLDHLDGSAGRGVPGAGALELNDLPAPLLGALDAGIDLLLREKVRHRDP